MGYTLVAAFDKQFEEEMEKILKEKETIKIPFGRDCDRISANRSMKYHMTLFHWAKQYDSEYLPRVEQLRFVPFEIKVIGTELLYAEEDSLLLYFSVLPGEHYADVKEKFKQIIEAEVSSFMHITIAVSKDHQYIRNLKTIVDEHFCYPFCLKVTELNLYHIWKPVTLNKIIRGDE